MEKRGQVTTFAILGVLILITVSVVFIVISSRNKAVESEISASNIDEVRRQVNLDVKLCFESIVENGILNGARHGGNVILMNQLSTSNFGGAGITDPCSMIPTATQEIKLLYGAKTKITSDGKCNFLNDRNEVLELDPNADLQTLLGTEFFFEEKEVLSGPTPGSGFQETLESYIRNNLPRCLKGFSRYSNKWTISADVETDKPWILDRNGDYGKLDEYFDNHNTPDDKAIEVIPTSGGGCPLDGKLVATLNMPLTFSRPKSFSGDEESFVLDKQEFRYNVDFKYFYDKARELYDKFNTPPISVPLQGKITDLATQSICINCGSIDLMLDTFRDSIEIPCGNNYGCHFYRATDPNTGAYFFNIKCGEYFFTPDGSIKKVNNDVNNVKVENLQTGLNGKQQVDVTVDGVPNTVEEGATMNIGGLDITFDGLNKDDKVVLIVGESVSYLWGYYFGCMPGSPDIPGSGMCFIECLGDPPRTESCFSTTP